MKKTKKVKLINKIIKSQQKFIEELAEINRQPIVGIVDAHNRTWVNVFTAQAYYYMAFLENWKNTL